MVPFRQGPGDFPQGAAKPGWYSAHPPHAPVRFPFYGGPVRRPSGYSGLAVASMVLGIVSLSLFCLFPIALLPSIVGVTLGAVALHKPGRGMAIAGFVMNMLVCIGNLLLFSYLALALVFAFAGAPQGSYYYL